MKKLLIVLLLTSIFASSAFAQQAAPPKFALVIGNGAYRHTTPLNNPVNDANDVAAALRTLGWNVTVISNAAQEQMETAIVTFKNRLTAAPNSYGFFFYAGHGVQSNGENFLIPVDANIQSESFLRSRAVSVQIVLDELNAAGNALNVVVLDACRDNPYSWRRSGTRGLSVVGHQPADSIIVYATSAGATAADGSGRNGLFTTHLLNNLRTPGLEVTEIFRLTMGDVARASNNQQRPAVYNQFSGLAYLGTQPAPVVVQPAVTSQPAAVQPAVTPTPAPSSTTTANELVRIQGGTFTMGSPANETGRVNIETQRQVTVSSFMMSMYEITQREYQEVMGTNPSRFTGDLNRPVEQVSWFDAVEYCNRRSQREGLTPAYTISGSGDNRTVTWNRNTNGYRLPTEAEWEYACRAGTTTAYNTGANISNNTGWYSANNGSTTRPVGQLPANAWGLYDMHGNVAEWCWDWFGNYPAGAQSDPTGASSGSARVLRGGSWSNSAAYIRSAYRHGSVPTGRGSNFGFRVIRP